MGTFKISCSKDGKMVLGEYTADDEEDYQPCHKQQMQILREEQREFYASIVRPVTRQQKRSALRKAIK